MKRMLKVTALLSSVTVVNIILNIIKIKVMAVMIGVSGMGIFSLFQSIYNIFLSLGNIIAGGGVVQAVAEASNENDYHRLHLLQYILVRIAVGLGLLSGIIIYIVRDELALYVFSNLVYAEMISWIGFIIIFVNLSLLWQSWLNGYHQVEQIVKVRFYSGILITLLTIILLYIFGEKAIVFSIMILPIPVYFLARYYIRPLHMKSKPILLKDFILIKDVLKLGLMLTLISLIFQVGVLEARSLIAHQSGVVGVGIVFCAWAISMSYIEIFLSALSVDYYPSLIAIKDDNSSSINLINKQIYFLLLILFPILLLMFVFSPFLISLLYSNDFIMAASILKYQLIGDIFKIISWVFGYVLIVHGFLKFSLILQLFWVGGYLLILWLGIEKFGLDITGIAFLISYMLSSILSYIFLKYYINFVFTLENKRLLIIISFISSVVLLIHFLKIDNNIVMIIESVTALIFLFYAFRNISHQIGGFKWKKSMNH